MPCINKHRCDTCPRPCSAHTQNKEFEKWYSSQTIADKQLVTGSQYPQCTVVWNSWSRDERRNAIRTSGLFRRLGPRDTALGHDF